MKKDDKIVVFGGNGMLGSSVVRRLQTQNLNNIITVSKGDRCDLLNQDRVNEFFKAEKPDYAFMVAGLVGGIQANNTRQADFLYQNAMMILHVLEALKNNSPNTKLLFTGSTCIYPRENPQPINENRFMMGPLEETNKGYAVAKGMGIIGCQLYRAQYGINAIAAMPTNMYGPNDNYNVETGHFIGALVIKMLNAKKTGESPTFWGTGKPRREAMYVDDCADALIYLMNNYNKPEIVNIGTGFDNSIREYVEIAQKLIGFVGEIKWDFSKPDGMYEKKTDISYLLSLMPEYKPRKFEQGLKDVLKADFNYDI
ncbi:MAG: GDP-L-fucose synthase [Ignavibacteriae bacterium]|nr:GDP-L-fucose synthase [Ignavibacteriota bacterium]